MNFSHLLVTTSKKQVHQQKISLDYLKSLNLETFKISPTTPEEVIDAIKTFNSSKSTVPNKIPAKIIQTVKDNISIPLSNLIHKSFNIGIFPNICNLARVAPVFKSKARQLCNKYSSISLFSNIGKIIEKLTYIKFNQSLEPQNCC